MILNNRLTCLKILFLGLFISILSSQELPPYQAIITDIQGSVLIKRSQKSDFVNAVWGIQLFAGDHLKTMDQSSVSLLFSNNNLIMLGANSTLTIAQNQINTDQSTLPSLNLSVEFPEQVPLLSFRKKKNGEVGALAGLRSGGGNEIVLISPRNSKISNLKPKFRWQSYKEYESYKITLYNDQGKLWTRTVNGSPYQLADVDENLVPGKSYFWYVEGQDLFDTKRSESIQFEVPDMDEYDEFNSRSDDILKMFENNSSSNSYHLVLGSFYEKEGYYLDAIAIFEKISHMNHRASLPHQILGNLYQKIGLKDMAIHELEKAVELSSENE
jgi:tetratricopeptide (TPR) repeat protein